MTQNQLEWMQQNGLDPSEYDMTPDGRVLPRQPLVQEAPQKEVMSVPRAFGTSFLGSLVPSAASLAGAAGGMKGGAALGAFGGPVGAAIGGGLGAIGGGLGAGYLAGKGQQALLENYAPEAVAEMQRAETDQPVASWAGGSAPALLTFKPSFKGISGLSAPLMSLEKDAMSKFAPAALNVGVNAASAGAGQLVNMSEGGDFSLPRFAADTAFGAIVSNPNALGRKMGFPSLDAPNIPKIPVEQPMDLGALRTADTEAREAARVAGETESARIMDETRGQMAAGGMTGREVEMFKTRPEMEWWKQPEATRIEDIRNIAKQAKQRMPKGMAEQLAGLPEVYDVVQNPEKFPAFLGASLEEALNAAHERSIQDKFLSPEDLAMQEKSLARRSGRDLPTETPLSDVNEAYKNYRRNAKEREEVSQRFMGAEERADIARMDETKRKLATQKASPEYRGEQMGAFRERAEAFTPEGVSRVAPEGWPPEVAKPTRAAVTTEEILGRQSQAAKPVDEGISLEQALKPTPEEVAKAAKIQADNVRVEAEQNASEIRKMQDLEAAQALSDEAAARLQSLQARQDELQKLAQRAPSVVRKGVAEQGAPDIAQAKQELADARAIAADLYSRLQKAGGEGLMSQADLDAATRLAAQRGLRVLPATPEQQAQGIRGAYVVNENGERVIYINPLAATADTAIHEIGHDVFKTSANERMQRSLMDTAMDSEAYKRELEYRLNEVDKNGKRVNTEQRAQDLALEEGLVQAFGEQHPNVKPGEIRQWFNALKSSVKSMVGMKISPEDALAWMHYATTEAVPWKGVAAVKAQAPTEDTLSQDTRYQRGFVEEAKNLLKRAGSFAETDYLAKQGPNEATFADAAKAVHNTKRFMEGQADAKASALYKLSPELQVMLGKHIGQEFDQKTFIKPPSEVAEAYNQYRQEWQKFWPDETNKAGHTVRAAGGQRGRQVDPYYGPFHMWSESVRDIITTKQGSPEYVKLQDDYIKQHVQAHQQNGIPLQEAQTRATAEFADEIRRMAAPYDETAVGNFAGARKAQGIPLPDSWREYNILKLVENYNKRSATDYAAQEHFEKSPEIMASLGSEKFFNDQPIPANVKASVPYIGNNTSVQSILREISGKPAQKTDSLAAGASRGVGVLALGPVTRATEIPATFVGGLRYLGAGDYVPGMMKFMEKLTDWSALTERSHASGLNKRDSAQNTKEVFGVNNDVAGFLTNTANEISKFTGLNKLESFARTLAQGWGEVLVQTNKHKAATGDKDAVRMLDTLSSDWRTRSDADLAAQFGRLMQGSYDMTQLPAWMLESGAAPYLTWSKWSAGQYSNFVKFALEPAMQGNVKPLIGHLLIGAMGGLAVDQVREWMNNREGRDVNWSELESWMQQNQGQLGAEGMKQLSLKLMNIMQGVGTFGIAGDMAKMVMTASIGGTPQGMAVSPVANAVFDSSKKVAAALKAIDDGEDFGLVLRQAMGDVAKTHVQVARVANNWLDEDENMRYDDRRRRRLFDELTGTPTQGGTFSVNYGNLAEKEFERGSITGKTGEEAMSLVSKARKDATSPEDYASRIRKLKTSQNAIMPSLERQPQKAARYLSFVEGAEPGKGSETLKRYYTRQNEDKYRKSLIEGMSGIR